MDSGPHFNGPKTAAPGCARSPSDRPLTAARASAVAAGCAAGLLGLLVWFGYGHNPPAPNPAATPPPRPTPTLFLRQ
jgi:hypothetical protein